MKKLIIICLFSALSAKVFAQEYERYKKLQDTTILSKNLNFEKNISIIVPLEWQKNIENKFPLIIIFDRQNRRNHNYIINTIDYLTSTEQMPSSIIISVESKQQYRYSETLHKNSGKDGLASENEKFIFEELIPLAEKEYQASTFRILIGHSRYGYFTTAMFHSRINDINGVIAMSPFFVQKNVDLTDSINQLNNYSLNAKKYYRFAIGNDYPYDFIKMDTIVKKIENPFLNIKGYHFKEADHNATPGLLIGKSLYEIFEDWSAIQSQYISNQQTELNSIVVLEKKIMAKYGIPLNFSLGILNGKGWYFYNEKNYTQAINAWQILMNSYPNFSQGYLYIIDAQIQLKQQYTETVEKFKKSLHNSDFYTQKEKNNLEEELKKIIN